MRSRQVNVSPSLKRSFLLLLAIVLVAPAWAQRGGLTVPRNLSQLTDRSAVIVRGTVTSARVEKHPELPGLNTVVVTLRVRETLKGQTGETFIFRQYLWDMRDLQDAAGYRKGDDVLLMMIAPSARGLSSPAGLQQGRFRILRDKTGREIAVNGQGNFKLFEGMDTEMAKKGITLSPKYSSLVSKHRGGPVAAEDLMGLIRELGKGSN